MISFTPDSHFFTATNGLSQSAEQAFGPISENDFNITAKFSSTGAKAFAICKGVILVQPQTENSDVVNLILRPYSQPITGFNIRYFIYRGLKKSDFFSGDNVLPASTGTSDFINKVNKSFSAYYDNGNVPPFLARYMGFDPANQPVNLSLDQFFFKDSEYVDSSGQFVEKTEIAFELPMIQKGAWLGNFNFINGECGIDVVLNYGDYKLPLPNNEFLFDLTYARAKSASINLASVTDSFQKKLKKEQIFQFLDVAAYYGFHAGKGTIQLEGKKYKDQEIYDQLVSKFYSKNRLYLYIQSDRGRSYNFYGNYLVSSTDTKNLKTGTSGDALTDATYQTRGWPLLIDESTQSKGNTKNKINFICNCLLMVLQILCYMVRRLR
ncbi:hypothetical protein [Pedobacter sp. NJ-S-72]